MSIDDPRLSLYDYHLPPENIALYPLANRSDSKMLVISRTANDRYVDSHTNQLSEFLHAGDVLVLNDTKVLAARVFAQRKTGGQVEILFLSHLPTETGWLPALVKPSRKLKVGESLDVVGMNGVTIQLTQNDGDGHWWVSPNVDVQEIMDAVGNMPIPPYLRRQTEFLDKERYQTVFAKEKGAVAAPTAGLHMTKEVITRLQEKGVRVVTVTLHVGIGTFKNLSSEDLDRGTLHTEKFSISEETAAVIREAKQQGHKIFAVGTTVTRCLESACVQQQTQDIVAQTGQTNIFIQEGYSFQLVDGLLTNFHLPKSSLLLLVSAFAGREHIAKAYQHAIQQGYRFFSYGDAMLIVS